MHGIFMSLHTNQLYGEKIQNLKWGQLHGIKTCLTDITDLLQSL